MKVAGTLSKAKEEESKNGPGNGANPTSDLYADINFEGMTTKQKRNLKKKLRQKRKKLEQSMLQSTQGDEQSKERDASDTKEPDFDAIGLDDIAVSVSKETGNKTNKNDAKKSNGNSN